MIAKLPNSRMGSAMIRAGLLFVVCGLGMSWQAAAEGTWVPLSRQPPEGIGTMLLLSDGTVMAQGGGGGYASANWYSLAPDTNGSYANGQWTTRQTANSTRLYCASVVLKDGRVFVAGAESGNGGITAEIYDSTIDHWQPISVPTNWVINFADSGGMVLSDGKVLVTPVTPATNGVTMIYDPTTNGWSIAPLVNGNDEDEAGLIKLPDNSILVNDFASQTSERYLPSLQRWVNDTNLPVNLYDPFGQEQGPQILLPNGSAFFIGSTPVTAVYTPNGTTAPGVWSPGTPTPSGLGIPDGPAAMMVNGIVVCVMSPTPTSANHFPSPTYFYEYDYTASPSNQFSQIHAPGGGYTINSPTWPDRMLDLPDGTVLFTSGSSQLYVYRPSATPLPLPAGKPTISSITANNQSVSYHLTGTKLNGISAGAAYGDDAQMDSNYPLVRMTNTASRNVYYARTYNWSSTSVMTGTNVVSTEFTPPGTMPQGNYSLVVVANGNPSDPVAFTGPVWVDFNYGGFIQIGTFDFPFPTLAQGTNAVAAGGTIAIKPGSSHETMTISKPMVITAVGGPATIGH